MAVSQSGHSVGYRSSKEVEEAGCSYEPARKPRVLVRRWRGWAWSFDSPAECTLSVRMCRAVWVDCVCMGGALICMW